MYEDKTLVCKDCGAEFVFTAGEQEFYAEKGFQNEPTRCKACRQARKASRAAGGPRQMFDAICAECGKPTQVPFEPKDADAKQLREFRKAVLPALRVRCTTLFAQNAESPLRFLSSPKRIVPYTAASALPPAADNRRQQEKFPEGKPPGTFLLQNTQCIMQTMCD